MDTFSTALTAAFSYWFMNETFTYLFVWGCVVLTVAGIVNGKGFVASCQMMWCGGVVNEFSCVVISMSMLSLYRLCCVS